MTATRHNHLFGKTVADNLRWQAITTDWIRGKITDEHFKLHAQHISPSYGLRAIEIVNGGAH